MTGFTKFTSIEKFSDVWIMAQRHNLGKHFHRSKTKLHGCFSANTKVTLANGETENISDLEIGAFVLTYNENTHEYEPNKITNVINQNLDKEWIKLSFDDGTFIECTKDHLFLTKNRSWVEAQNLNAEDVFVEETF